MSTESFNSWSLILNSLKTVANDFDNALNQKIEWTVKTSSRRKDVRDFYNN